MKGVFSHMIQYAFQQEDVNNLFSRRAEMVSTLKRVSTGLMASSQHLNWYGAEPEWQGWTPVNGPIPILLGGKVLENGMANNTHGLSYDFIDCSSLAQRYFSFGAQEDDFIDVTRIKKWWNVESSFEFVKPLEVRPAEQIYWKGFERDELEDQVFKTYEFLSTYDNSVAKHFSNYLHEYLHQYAHSNDETFLYQAANAVFFYVEFTSTAIKNISAHIQSLLCKYFLCVKRDLRTLFRSIVRFLFKNMDADDDHIKILLVPVSKQNFLIQSLDPNGYTIHHNLFKNTC